MNNKNNNQKPEKQTKLFNKKSTPLNTPDKNNQLTRHNESRHQTQYLEEIDNCALLSVN